MPAYVIALMEVHDPATYREYAIAVGATVEPFGGRILVANDSEAREGTPPFPRTVIGEFPTLDAARAWYDSDVYQKVLPLRLAATNGTLFMVEGLTLPSEPHPPSQRPATSD
jgi:uncharacterized protein (DUF1330 family)